jgi:hypothetical protein
MKRLVSVFIDVDHQVQTGLEFAPVSPLLVGVMLNGLEPLPKGVDWGGVGLPARRIKNP